MKEKVDLCVRYRRVFEGNFSANPLLQSLDGGWTPLTLDILDHLLKYWSNCNRFSNNNLKRYKDTTNIQLTANLQMVDEIYCLLSLFIHLFHTIKVSTNYIKQPINKDKLTERILTLELKLEEQY